MTSYLIYLFHSIIGAILFALLYHFSLYDNTIFCALIPALPVLGFFGLYLVHENKKNVLKYIKDIVAFFVLYVILFGLMYIFYVNTSDLLLSIGLSLITWLSLTVFYITK